LDVFIDFKTDAKIFQFNAIIDQLTIKLPALDFGDEDIWGIDNYIKIA